MRQIKTTWIDPNNASIAIEGDFSKSQLKTCLRELQGYVEEYIDKQKYEIGDRVVVWDVNSILNRYDYIPLTLNDISPVNTNGTIQWVQKCKYYYIYGVVHDSNNFYIVKEQGIKPGFYPD